jgi:hypothetical protein
MKRDSDQRDQSLPEVTLRCKEKRFGKSQWTLKLSSEGGQLCDDTNKIRAEFSLARR